jgi:hypothetical protein
MIVSAGGLYAAVKGNEKKAAPPVITSAMQLAEELQKRGVTGSETDSGVIQKIFIVLGLRQSRGISSHEYSVQIYDFKSAAGFNIAVWIFHVFTLLSDDEVYKSRPYIVAVNFQNRENLEKVTAALKEIIPDIKDVKEKEF